MPLSPWWEGWGLAHRGGEVAQEAKVGGVTQWDVGEKGFGLSNAPPLSLGVIFVWSVTPLLFLIKLFVPGVLQRSERHVVFLVHNAIGKKIER